MIEFFRVCSPDVLFIFFCLPSVYWLFRSCSYAKSAFDWHASSTLTRFAACAFFRYNACIYCKLWIIVRFGVRAAEINFLIWFDGLLKYKPGHGQWTSHCSNWSSAVTSKSHCSQWTGVELLPHNHSVPIIINTATTLCAQCPGTKVRVESSSVQIVLHIPILRNKNIMASNLIVFTTLWTACHFFFISCT